MTRDDIIRMAQEAGAEIHGHPEYQTICVNDKDADEFVGRLVEIVRADAIVDEREACARIADSMDSLQDGAIGRVIRARENT